MILTKGMKIDELKQGLYSLRLERHVCSLVPLVKASDVKEVMEDKGYYDDNGVVENVELRGPFENLNMVIEL